MQLLHSYFVLKIIFFHYVNFSLQDVVRKIESTKTGSHDKPMKDVVIVSSGKLDVPNPFHVTKDDATE